MCKNKKNNEHFAPPSPRLPLACPEDGHTNHPNRFGARLNGTIDEPFSSYIFHKSSNSLMGTNHHHLPTTLIERRICAVNRDGDDAIDGRRNTNAN